MSTPAMVAHAQVILNWIQGVARILVQNIGAFLQTIGEFVAADISREVPVHLRNAPTKLMSELGYGKEYKYAHDYPHHYVPNENYWPDNITKPKFYKPTVQGLEERVTNRLDFLKTLDKK